MTAPALVILDGVIGDCAGARVQPGEGPLGDHVVSHPDLAIGIGPRSMNSEGTVKLTTSGQTLPP